MIAAQLAPGSRIHDTDADEPGPCPGCGCADRTDFFTARDLPVSVGIFYDSPEAATRAPTGDVALSFCQACGLVENRLFDPAQVPYEPGYEVALHHSATFERFMEGVSTRLMDRFDLRHKTVLEIGCGCGYFLRMLCQRGPNDGVGIDPTVAREGTQTVGQGSVQFIRDFFCDKYAYLEPDFICCLSAFEHIPQPFAFLRRLRRMIGDRRPGVYFEIFNAFDAFCRAETWSIHYEQCNYFSKQCFADMFRRAGFAVSEAGTCYEGGQYLFVDALPGGAVPDPCDQRAELPEELKRFSDSHQASLKTWRARLDRYRQHGERAAVWGTGGKGISFLNSLDTHGVVPYVVEINPDKQGKFTPGTGHLIVPPARLAQDPPHRIIITNALYEKEMRQQARDVGVDCEFLIA